MSELSIDVQKRTETGTNANRRLRQSGKIPAVVYGGGKDTVPIQLARKALIDLLKSGQNENAIFLLKLGDSGQERHAMIHDMQIDPLTRQIVHIDFQRIVMTEKVKVQVPIELVGTAYGVKTEGGMIDFVHREVMLESLPGDIPKHIDVDVSELRIGQHIEAKDLLLPDGVTLAEEPDRIILSLSHTKAEESAADAVAEPEVVVAKRKTEEGA
jgi:large subunit ribosomal protein L25